MATKSKTLCNVPDCDRPAHKQGICRKHADMNYALACSAEGCDKPLHAKGRCRAHWMRWWRTKNGQKAPPAGESVRSYGEKSVVVFTRIPETVARTIMRAGTGKHYTRAQKILEDWAAEHATG